MNKTLRNLTIAFLIFQISILTAYGAYTLWSPVVEQEVVDYTLTLTSSSNGLYVTLTGNLQDGTGTPIVGGTISLYTVDDLSGTNPVLLTTVITDSNGDYAYTFLELVGTHYYRASYDVT